VVWRITALGCSFLEIQGRLVLLGKHVLQRVGALVVHDCGGGLLMLSEELGG
jgi:hypothetical protein